MLTIRIQQKGPEGRVSREYLGKKVLKCRSSKFEEAYLWQKENRAIFSDDSVTWCGQQDLNLHEYYLIATSTLRVCQFHHDRENVTYVKPRQKEKQDSLKNLS